MKTLPTHTKILATLAALILPLTLTGCAQSSEAASKEATLTAFVDLAKINAARDGNDLTLDYIMDATKDSSIDYETFKQKEVPAFEKEGKAITATYLDGSTCGIVIENKDAKITC